MKTLPTLAASIIFIPFLIASALAQQEVRVRALSFQPAFPPEIHAHDPSGTASAGNLEVKSFLNHESNKLSLIGPSVSFTRRSNPVSATNVGEVLAKFEFSPEIKSCILVFLPESPKPMVLNSRVLAIDDSTESFPAGSFKIANFASVPVKIELEAEVCELAAGEVKIMTKLPYRDNQSVSMRAYVKKHDQWQLMSTGIWTDPGTRRVLQLITEDLATKEVELRGVRDVAAP